MRIYFLLVFVSSLIIVNCESFNAQWTENFAVVDSLPISLAFFDLHFERFTNEKIHRMKMFHSNVIKIDYSIEDQEIPLEKITLENTIPNNFLAAQRFSMASKSLTSLVQLYERELNVNETISVFGELRVVKAAGNNFENLLTMGMF